MNAFLKDQAATLRVSWLLVFAVATAGLFTIVLPGCSAKTATQTQANAIYQEAVANEKTVEEATRLQAAQARVESDLRKLGGQQNEGQVVATALRLFNDEGKRYHVEVRTIVPAASTVAAPSAASPSSSAPALDPLIAAPVTLGLRGHFRDVVALLVDLPKHDVLIDLHDVQMTARDSDRLSNQPSLDVTVQATIYRIRSLAFSEGTNAATASR